MTSTGNMFERPITAKLLSELDTEKLAEAIRDTDPLLSDRILTRITGAGAHADAKQLQLRWA